MTADIDQGPHGQEGDEDTDHREDASESSRAGHPAGPEGGDRVTQERDEGDAEVPAPFIDRGAEVAAQLRRGVGRDRLEGGGDEEREEVGHELIRRPDRAVYRPRTEKLDRQRSAREHQEGDQRRRERPRGVLPALADHG